MKKLTELELPKIPVKNKDGRKEEKMISDMRVKMRRIEVICSQAVEEDFLSLCKAKGIGRMFTKVPSVMGQGYSVPKMGDAVWPQMNCLFLLFCCSDEAEEIVHVVEELRKQYPGEGCACFISKAQVR